MTHKPPAPLENDSLRNRLVAMTHQRFSLQTIGKGSGQLLVSAMQRLGQPIARRFVMPGEPNHKIAEGKQRLANMPRGTKGLFRTDGSIILAGNQDDLLAAARDEGLDLQSVYLAGRKLAKRDMGGYRMRGADLRLADLTRTTLDDADLSMADLRRAQLKRLQANGLTAERANFDEVRLYAGWINRARLSGAKFRGASFHATEFNGSDLSGADFTGARFKRAHNGQWWDVEMKHANLTKARFSVDANFKAIDFTGANLDGVILIGRDGQPIEGAKLRRDGTVIYTEIRPVPDQDTPRLT